MESGTPRYAAAVQHDFGQAHVASMVPEYDADPAYAEDEPADPDLHLHDWQQDAEPAPAAEEWDDDPLTSSLFRLRASLSQPHEDEEAAVSNVGLRRAGIDTAARSGRRPALGAILRGAAGSPRGLAAVACAVAVVILGNFALQRHAGYTSDLREAQTLQAAHQYTGALALYRKAEGEWPAHSDASAGETTVQTQMAGEQAATAQVTAVAQAHTTAEQERADMYLAKSAERRLAAKQQDSATSPPQP